MTAPDYEKEAVKFLERIKVNDLSYNGATIKDFAAFLKARDLRVSAAARKAAFEEAAKIIFNTKPPEDWTGHTGRYGGWLKGVHQFKDLLFAKSTEAA